MLSSLEQIAKAFFEEHMRGFGDSADRVISESAALAQAVASSRRLAKTLTDEDIEPVTRSSLIDAVTGGRLSDTTSHFLSTILLEERVDAASVAGRFADAAADFAVVAADADGTVAKLESDLHSFAGAIQANPELRQALADPAVTIEDKQDFLVTLVGGKAHPYAVVLLQMLVGMNNGLDVDEMAIRLSQRAAARRNMVIADIRTAVELDAQRKSNLTEALSRSVGSPVQPRFSIDPNILGSVIVRIGDEVLDGSVRHRLEQARNAVAG